MSPEYNRLPCGTKWRMDLDEPFTVSSKRVPNQLRAYSSVTIAVTVLLYKHLPLILPA